jgi:hypothetical protein
MDLSKPMNNDRPQVPTAQSEANLYRSGEKVGFE